MVGWLRDIAQKAIDTANTAYTILKHALEHICQLEGKYLHRVLYVNGPRSDYANFLV